ncbi:hypothetical protein I546_5854 [Mycobacterium kansasii 732]|nr:hypothetical protein I546_5854 [Mycobacterium kansasii 732]
MVRQCRRHRGRCGAGYDVTFVENRRRGASYGSHPGAGLAGIGRMRVGQ